MCISMYFIIVCVVRAFSKAENMIRVIILFFENPFFAPNLFIHQNFSIKPVSNRTTTIRERVSTSSRYIFCAHPPSVHPPPPSPAPHTSLARAHSS